MYYRTSFTLATGFQPFYFLISDYDGLDSNSIDKNVILTFIPHLI